jgi:uncharacterized membrane protein
MANLSNACRNVFFKSFEFKCEETIYPSMCFVSFFIFLPFYMLRSGTKSILNQNTDMVYFLLLSALGSFLYNFFSFRVLASLSPISHSVLNIFKRVFTIMASLVYFSKHLSPTQIAGMIVADVGVLSYSYVKLICKQVNVKVSPKQIKMTKIITVCLGSYICRIRCS